MILVLNLNQRERDELVSALYEHRQSLSAHNIPGRTKTTDAVIEKFNHARSEALKRP